MLGFGKRLCSFGFAMLLAAAPCGPAAARQSCTFGSAAPKILLQDGDVGQAGARLLQVWDIPNAAVLWSTAEPAGYQAFRAAAKRHLPNPDPRRLLAAAPSINSERVARFANEWIRPARCLQKLLYQEQHRRIDTFAEPTEFAAFVLRSPDQSRLRVYFYTNNRDGIGRMGPISDPVAADHDAGWTVMAGLHNHAFHPGAGAELNGVPAPSLPDAQFNARFAALAGMQQAWITNGLHTVEIPASAFGDFEGVDTIQ